MEVQIERIERDIETINSFNATPGRGITRLTFSKEYGEARSYIVEELRRIGADVSTTLGGNVRGRLEGSKKGTPSVMMGSHIDSVVQGGRFDGVAGVVSALEAARVIKEKNISHGHPIDVVVFAEEEGTRFGSVMIGSRAWVGKLTPEDLRRTRDKDGAVYLEAMEQCGIVCEDPSVLKAEQVKAMLELHIEQSVVLEKRGLQIGLVEGIAGIKQFHVTVQGVPNHAGGTPMGLRYDALQGAVRIIEATEKVAREMGEPTVATVGFVSCEPGLVNVIPGRVQFTLDIRDTDSKRLGEAVKKMMAVIERTCRERSLTYDINQRSDIPPVALSRKVVQLIENAARQRKIEPLRMMSGALHDSSVLAEITDVGMIFVPSKEGKSHCPDEFTDLKDIQAGADILLDAVVKLAS